MGWGGVGRHDLEISVLNSLTDWNVCRSLRILLFFFNTFIFTVRSPYIHTMTSNVHLYTTEEQVFSNHDSWVRISVLAVLLQIHITSPSSA